VVQDSSQARQKILDAASSLFAERGFDGARVDEIALRAGVNKAMLYYYVGNKQTLYTAVLKRNIDCLEKELLDSLGLQASPAQRFRSVISTIGRFLQSFPDHPRIMLREFASGGDRMEPVVIEGLVRILEMIRRLLDEGVRSGEFRATEPVMTHIAVVGASLFLNAVQPLRSRVAAIGPTFEVPGEGVDIGAFLSDFLLHGLATSSPGEMP